MSNEPTKEAVKAENAQLQEQLNQAQQAYQQMSITVDSLKQHVFDLNMQLVDKNSELMVAQGQARELQVALSRATAPTDIQMSDQEE